MVQVLRKDHGFQVDHMGLAVPDTRTGVDWLDVQSRHLVNRIEDETIRL